MTSVRIAAIADVHFGRHPASALQPIFARLGDEADVLLICGDLTDHGLPAEARGLAREITQHLPIPVVAVLGNHDCESGQEAEVRAIMSEAGVVVLDGDAHEVRGVGFAGVKGFCGGFGARALGAWGEPSIKAFVREALDEALKLETALARLRATKRVAMLHRIGRLEIGESSVLIAVSAAHRGDAFEACRYAIDTLKRTVPVWKKEHFEDGEVWVGLQGG